MKPLTLVLAFLALIAVLGFTLGKNDDRWPATWGGAGVGLILGLIIVALIPVMPFTEQFARETTPRPKSRAGHPRRAGGRAGRPPGRHPSLR